jgi:acyl carrier protein
MLETDIVREQLIRLLHETVEDRLDLDAVRAAVQDGSNFAERLTLDSLDLVEFYLRVGERFNLSIQQEALSQLHTVDDVIGLLQRSEEYPVA